MIKYIAQNVDINNVSEGFTIVRDGTTEYTYEGEEWEKTAYLARITANQCLKPQPFEKLFCPDSAKLYYWSPSQNTFREVGLAAITTV